MEVEHISDDSRKSLITTGSETRSSYPFPLPPQGIELEAVEREFVIQALERTGGNQTAAAKLLGISRYALRNRIEKFGLKGERPRV